MTEHTQRLVDSLQEKFSLIKNELLKLKVENKELKGRLEEFQLMVDETKVKHEELEYKYNTLKVAKVLESSAETESVKKQINAMVREIETCIELIDQ